MSELPTPTVVNITTTGGLVEPVELEPVQVKKSWRPTNKWITARITGLVALLGVLLTGDPTITDPEVLLILGYVGEAGVSYFTRNASTPEGIPVKEVSG